MKRKYTVSVPVAALLMASSMAAYAASFQMPCRVGVAWTGNGLQIPAISLQMPKLQQGAAGGAAEGGAMEEASYSPCPVGMDLDAEEAGLLARIAMAEAEGEDLEGKALVIRTVLNRVEDKAFPGSIRGVLMQEGQFSPVSDGRFGSVVPDEDCWSALELVVRDMWDPSRGATYFESRSDSTWHAEHLEYLFQHGKHYFYKSQE